MPPMAALIIVILNWPGTCRAMNSASTLVSRFFRNTVAVAAFITKSVSSLGGISPSARRQVTSPVRGRRGPVIALVAAVAAGACPAAIDVDAGARGRLAHPQAAGSGADELGGQGGDQAGSQRGEPLLPGPPVPAR